MYRHLQRTTQTLPVIAAILSGGCAMIGPDFKTPDATVAEQWTAGDTSDITSQPPTDSQWWKLFNDPVLDKLVQTAYEQNLSLQIAGLRVLGARAQLGIVTGSLYPQSQTLSGNYSNNRGKETLFTDKYFSQAGTGFDAARELDFWGQFRRGIESADANLIANIASYDDVLVTLTAEVARNYALIRTLEERIRLARENITIQHRSLELTTNQFETGSVTELDMQQATTQLRSMHRFLAGSARIIDDFRLRSPRQQKRGRKRRKRTFEAAILPISAQLLNIEKHLDYALFPDNTPEKVQHLVASLQAVRLRLQSLEASYTTAESESSELMRSLDALHGKWRERIHTVLGKWARLEQADTLITEWSTQSSLSQELEQQLDSLQQNMDSEDLDGHALRNIYAVLGSTQSLLEAMKELGDSMQQINWGQWSVARF